MALTATLIAGCGASSTKLVSDTVDSPSAQTLIRQTFGADHRATSGNVSFGLTIAPTGSSSITKPVTLSISGPFELATGSAPAAMDLTLSVAAQGRQGSLQLILTGGKAYITVDGNSYAVPSSVDGRLKSDLPAGLGIDPGDWLSDPQVEGTATIDGAATTHIHATLDVDGMLKDLDRALQSMAGSGSGPLSALPGGADSNLIANGIPSSLLAEIEGAVGSPSLDLWTGTNDRILRRMRIGATVTVPGALASALGGLRSAAITLSFNQSDVNQPQTIAAPSSVKPYAALQTTMRSLAGALSTGTTG